jgi:hypothetical protein
MGHPDFCGEVTGGPPAVVVVEVGEAVVAGEGDEVIVAEGVVALEAGGHGFMVALKVGVRAVEVPHSCRKVRVMNGPPARHPECCGEVTGGPPALMSTL